MDKFIHSSPQAGRTFYQNFHDKGKIVMLNLLKFRAIADYTTYEMLAPEKEITGEEAYRLYMKSVISQLSDVGSRIIYFGKSHTFLIGPDTEKWDAILIVEHASVATFISFAQNEAYLKYLGHRTAALEDARLLPSTEISNYFE